MNEVDRSGQESEMCMSFIGLAILSCALIKHIVGAETSEHICITLHKTATGHSSIDRISKRRDLWTILSRLSSRQRCESRRRS